MKTLASTGLLVLGTCLATLGAAGFRQGRLGEDTGEPVGAPQAPREPAAADGRAAGPEPYAPLLLGAGAALVAGGGLLRRRRASGRAGAGGAGGPSARDAGWFRERIEDLRARAARLDQEKQRLSPAELHARVTELLEGPFYELTSRHEELVALVGFTTYARIWEGLATAERLLARAWSMLTDGFPEGACVELSHVLRSLELAAAAAAVLGEEAA